MVKVESSLRGAIDDAAISELLWRPQVAGSLPRRCAPRNDAFLDRFTPPSIPVPQGSVQ